MEAPKGVSNSLLLSAAVTFLIVIIYGTFRAGPDSWEPNEKRPASFLSFAKNFQLPVSRKKNSLPGFGSWFDGCKSL